HRTSAGEDLASGDRPAVASVHRVNIGLSWAISGSGQGPRLVGAAVAGPDVLLRAVDGTGARIVEALARPGAHERGRRPGRPELVGTAVAGPQLDQYPVGRTLAGHVEALAGQSYRPVADRPGLRRAARRTGVDDD